MDVFSHLGQATVTSGGGTTPASGTQETWTIASSTLPAVSSALGQICRVVDKQLPGEVLFITNISGGSAIVTRGAEGTTPVSHAPGFTIINVVTAGLLASLTGGQWKPPVQEATTTPLPANTYSGTALTLTANANGALTVDGVAVAVNDLVLVAGEATAANNGIYAVTATGGAGAPYVLTRASTMAQGSQVPGAVVLCEQGTANAGKMFLVASAGPFTIGTTAITWTAFGQSLDSAAADIKSFGTGSAGLLPLAARADHVHPDAGKLYAFALGRAMP